MKKIFDRIVLLLNGVAIALFGLALGDFLLHPLAEDFIFHSSIFRPIVILLLVPLTLIVGFLIIRRVPGNAVGPLLIVWSVSMTFLSIREGIGPLALALFTYFDLFGWIALFLMFLHFPDGKIYPPGASSGIYFYTGLGVLTVSIMFLSWATFPQSNQVANPFFLPILESQAELISTVAVLIYSPLLIVALVSPLVRFWKGSLLERQQIKLLALSAGVIIIYTLLGLIAYPLLTGGQVMDPGNDLFGVVFYLAAGLLPPLAIGVAVLRYRLWDIDLVIRRTLVYSILTVSLTLIYFGSVVVLQSLFTTVAGHQSPAAIVLSTLTIAVLFTPFRRHIQTFIDRRFYRKKYDTERVLASFSTTLKEKVDLDQLTNSILVVVEETMQPIQLSLWLRDGNRPPGARPFDKKSS
jgi:hypothetical protein